MCAVVSCRQAGSGGVSVPAARAEEEPSVEENVARWVAGVSKLPLEEARDSAAAFFGRFSSDTATLRLVRIYLYDTESPWRDEDIYLPIARGLSESEFTPDSLRESFAREARLCSLSPRGSRAPDFVFRAGGQDMHLRDVPGQYILLIFSNPGCRACKEISAAITENRALLEACMQERLSVVNVYIDKDVKTWEEYANTLPPFWYKGYDPSFRLRDNKLYSIRAVPCIYLLDMNKIIIMKDPPIQRVMMYLINNLQR